MEQQRETRMAVEPQLYRTQEPPFRRSEQNLAATFYQGAVTLPLAD
jgi:hypothetical protein